MWRDFESSFGAWGMTVRNDNAFQSDGPTNITLSNSSITTEDSTVGALAMVGGAAPATFSVTSVTEA